MLTYFSRPEKCISIHGGRNLLYGSEERAVAVKKILVSTRRPNTDNLGLKQVGVRLNDDGGIWVNERLETSVEGVYPIGDSTGGWMLSNASSSMAVTAAENTMIKRSKFSFHLVSRGIWTIPQVGMVGLSEEEAKERGIDIEIGLSPYSIHGLSMARDEMAGAVKVISRARYGEILGVHIVGANATELVGKAVLAMQLESTVRELANTLGCTLLFQKLWSMRPERCQTGRCIYLGVKSQNY